MPEETPLNQLNPETRAGLAHLQDLTRKVGKQIAGRVAAQEEATKTPKHHPSVSALLCFFRFEHLPEHLQRVASPFGELANQVADRAPFNPETTVALRKLLEAKDCAVRAALAG